MRARTAPVSTCSSGAPRSTCAASTTGCGRACCTPFDAHVVDVEQRRSTTRIRESDRDEREDHEQRDPQPPAPGLASHLDAALANARVDRRRHRRDLRPEPDEVELGFEPDAGARGDDPLHLAHERVDVGRGRARLGDEEVRVLLGDTGATDPQALAPARLDEPPGGIAGRVREHRSRVLAPGLVLPPPAHDLVDAPAPSARVGGAAGEGRGHDHAPGPTAERR